MIPSPEQIKEKRHAMRRRARVWAVALVILGLMPAINETAGRLIEWNWDFEIYEIKWIVGWTAMFLLPAAFLWIFRTWLAARLVPPGDKTCINCGYEQEKLLHPRCPECGIDAPPAFTVPTQTPAPEVSPAPTPGANPTQKN